MSIELDEVMLTDQRLSTLLTEVSGHATVPQPEGKVVAAAYKDGRLSDVSTLLHLVALLMGKTRPNAQGQNPVDCSGPQDFSK